MELRHPALCMRPGKAVEDVSKDLNPCTQTGDWEVASGSWLPTSPAPAVVTIQEVNQLMENFSLSFLSLAVPFK